MRNAVAAGLVAVGVLTAASAGAQDAPKKYKPQPLLLQKEKLGTDAYASVARGRMRNGDCAGAIEAFDAAVNTSVDPTLRRDRGVCHEKLGHPYPAIDDYRYYLFAEPDAPDSESIRGRLAKLEMDTTGRSSETSGDTPAGGGGDSGSGSHGGMSASASLTIDGEGAHGSTASSSSSGGRDRDKMDYTERDDDPLNSSLRRGKGWGVAPLFLLHKWYNSNEQSFGDSSTWAEGVGIQVRYSVNTHGAVVGEAGYEHFNISDLYTLQGLSSQLAYELRFGMDADWNNELFVMPGLGYEHLILQSSVATGVSTEEGAFVPRVRFGYRRMLGLDQAIDLGLDLGVGSFFIGYDHFPYDSKNGVTLALFGVHVGLVWGM